MGLSENTIKSFCRKTQVPKAELEHVPADACRWKWWNSHLHLVQRKAVYHIKYQHCGREFEIYGNSRRKYCCHACYIAERFDGEARV